MGLKEMRKLSLIAVIAVLSTDCLAQGGPNPGQCEQVRSAIAQYGQQAARKHAMANHGLSMADILRIEQECGVGGRSKKSNR